MYRRGLLSALPVAVALAGCSDAEPANGTPPDADEESDDRVDIETHELVRADPETDEETVAIEGTVRIHEGGLQHIELRGRFFDAEDGLLDTTFERLRELTPGTQRFEVRYPEVGPAAASVERYDIEITTVV